MPDRRPERLRRAAVDRRRTRGSRVSSPISTQVSSPVNLRSCGSPPSTEPIPTRHALGASVHVALERGARLRSRVPSPISQSGPTMAHGPTSHVGAELAPTGRHDRRGMDARALIGRGPSRPCPPRATTAPSTFATPCILHDRCRAAARPRARSAAGRRAHRLAELHVVERHEVHDLALRVVDRAHQQHAAHLRHRLDDQHARHDRMPGKVPLEERLVDRDVLDARRSRFPSSISRIRSTSRNG